MIFAQLFTFIIILGIIHGFFALPVMLSQWGPLPVCDNHGGGHAAAGGEGAHHGGRGGVTSFEMSEMPAYEAGSGAASPGGESGGGQQLGSATPKSFSPPKLESNLTSFAAEEL